MQARDKFRSDLEQAQRRAGGGAELASLKAFLARQFPRLGSETQAALQASLAEKWRDSPDAARAWLGALGSILLMDYDDTPLTIKDWSELRESIALDSGTMDMELLTYIMTLVLDHGAL